MGWSSDAVSMGDDLEASLAACQARGGEVLAGPKEMGWDSVCSVTRNPGGAVAALYRAGA